MVAESSFFWEVVKAAADGVETVTDVAGTAADDSVSLGSISHEVTENGKTKRINRNKRFQPVEMKQDNLSFSSMAEAPPPPPPYDLGRWPPAPPIEYDNLQHFFDTVKSVTEEADWDIVDQGNVMDAPNLARLPNEVNALILQYRADTEADAERLPGIQPHLQKHLSKQPTKEELRIAHEIITRRKFIKQRADKARRAIEHERKQAEHRRKIAKARKLTRKIRSHWELQMMREEEAKKTRGPKYWK